MKKERNFKLYLHDMIDAIEWILKFTENITIDEFVSDRKTCDAVIRNLEIIGEASKSIPTHVKEQGKEVPWREMYLMRNKVSHEYFGIDYELVWNIAKNELPNDLSSLRTLIQKIE